MRRNRLLRRQYRGPVTLHLSGKLIVDLVFVSRSPLEPLVSPPSSTSLSRLSRLPLLLLSSSGLSVRLAVERFDEIVSNKSLTFLFTRRHHLRSHG